MPSTSQSATGSLEGALSRTEADADSALRAHAALQGELKKAKKAAAQGSIRDLEKSLAAADQTG